MAYNPSSSGFSYHQNNRHMTLIDFYTREIGAVDIKELQRVTRLLHGIGMFLTWWYDNLNSSLYHRIYYYRLFNFFFFNKKFSLFFPISIFFVRFLKHTNNYLRIHRTIQLLGGISISSFGAAAIATMTSNTKSPHAWYVFKKLYILYLK